jgi:pimeloyl-ACP methyl ester carboxylesterase
VGALVLPDGSAATRFEVPGAARGDGHPVVLAGAAVGPPAAQAVVLAHGVGSSARFVAAACAAPIVAAGWRLVVYDARGHGASTPCPDPADHHLDAHVADLERVAAVVEPIAAVGGISLGGHAALRADVPGDRVVCLPSWWGPSVRGEGVHAAVAAEVRAVGVLQVIERLRADTVLPGWLRETLVADYSRHDAASLAAALTALDGADGPSEADLDRLPAHVAVVAWRDDPAHPFEVAEHLAARLGPRGSLTELAIADLDASLTRLGDAIVRGLRTC